MAVTSLPLAPNPAPPLRGWLAFFAFQMTLGFVLNLYGIWRDAGRWWRFSHSLRQSSRLFVSFVGARGVLELVIALLIGRGLYLLFCRRFDAVAYWRVALLVLIALVLTETLVAAAEHRMAGVATSATSSRSPFLAARAAGALLVNLAWYAYWRRSRRVRRTFVSQPQVQQAA